MTPEERKALDAEQERAANMIALGLLNLANRAKCRCEDSCECGDDAHYNLSAGIVAALRCLEPRTPQDRPRFPEPR